METDRRPCRCGDAQEGPWRGGWCRHCWHAINTQAYRDLWGIADDGKIRPAYVTEFVRNPRAAVRPCCPGDGAEPMKENHPVQFKWAYGVTTVPSRMDGLLPRTLNSLANSGFDSPRLFVDDCTTRKALEYEDKFGFEVTCRSTQIRAYGNWILALGELYIRNPTADRYAIFQDDFVTGINLRRYLEKSTSSEAHQYWNLYTFPSNEGIRPEGVTGWYESNQYGRGAVALVFNAEGVTTLLKHQHMIDRVRDVSQGKGGWLRAWKSIDGGVVDTFRKVGWKEMVHSPSLVQHTGDVSTVRNGEHKKAESFRGEQYDFLDLLKIPEVERV